MSANLARQLATPKSIAGPTTHNVRQGELKVCLGEQDWVGTLLGSCIALCLRDTASGIGGLNHFLLPSSDDGGDAQASARFGGYAIEMLINSMMRGGADRSRLEGKIFGGAKLFTTNGVSIGEKNIAFVKEFCELEEIPIVKSDVGGPHARKILFQPATGRARVMRLKGEIEQSLSRRDAAYNRSLTRTDDGAGSAELFD